MQRRRSLRQETSVFEATPRHATAFAVFPLPMKS